MQPKVHLEDIPLWQRFQRLTNEMIVTKGGRRMFPVVRVSLSDLDPRALYSVTLEMRPADGYRWKYMNGEWMTTGKAENVKRKPSVYVHPESPNFGSHWTKDTLSFSRVKLTNSAPAKNNQDQLHINSLHKYEPYVCLQRLGSTGSETVASRCCPQAQFIAVTAYQNDEITGLKITYNPFAKAFQDQKDTKSCRNLEINMKLPNLPAEDVKTNGTWSNPGASQQDQQSTTSALRHKLNSRCRETPYSRYSPNTTTRDSQGFSGYEINTLNNAMGINQEMNNHTISPSHTTPPQSLTTPTTQTTPPSLTTPPAQHPPTLAFNSTQHQPHQLYHQQPSAYFHAYQPYPQMNDARHDTRHDARTSNWWPGPLVSHIPTQDIQEISPIYYQKPQEVTPTSIPAKLPGCFYVTSSTIVPSTGFSDIRPSSNTITGFNWTQLTPP